ncbi:MAG: RepB family plasmid replication initiator protein [Candidatus Desulfaltia sp.]|nr:RepB family plasmid replication initiator protein [Candidatus Desulfaltia sp.]
MTTKKSAPATANDQGKNKTIIMGHDSKSPAASQQNIDPDLFAIIQRAQSHGTPVAETDLRTWETEQVKLRRSSDYNEFAHEVAQAGQIPEQQVFSFLPHQMAKTSIFFPMSRKDMTEEARKITRIEHQTPWGMIVVEGVKLAIYEEDIFLALLQLAGKNSNLQKVDYGYLLKTNLPEIAHVLYGNKSHTKKTYDRILASLNRFKLVGFELVTGQWRKKGKEKLHVKTRMSFGGIISTWKLREDTGAWEIDIYFAPAFFEFFLKSMLTNINLTIRRRLKKDGSKALLRFISTHNHPGKMHILTVLNAINYNTNQPMFRLRSRLKGFIQELKEQKILGSKTRVYKNDMMFFDVLSKSPKSLPEK